MARPLPTGTGQWFKEIGLAWNDARKVIPFAPLTGVELTEADLFHLAAMVCLKFRGRKPIGKEATRVSELTLANYVANVDAKRLQSKPKLAFALCYVAAHVILKLIDEATASKVMEYCEEKLDAGGSASEQAPK